MTDLYSISVERRPGQKVYVLICGTSGVLTVTTAQGSWIIPTHRGMWIPGGIEHEVRMQGIVTP
jgi:hypothetical protein